MKLKPKQQGDIQNVNMTNDKVTADGFYIWLIDYLFIRCCHQLPSMQDAQDIVSETMYKLLKRNKKGLLDSTDKVSWVRLGHHILRAEIANYYRGRDKERKLSEGLISDNSTESIEEIFQNQETYEQLMMLAQQFLSASERAFIALYAEGYSDEEIITMMQLDIQPKTVDSRRRNALNKLKNLYSKP